MVLEHAHVPHHVGTCTKPYTVRAQVWQRSRGLTSVGHVKFYPFEKGRGGREKC